MATIKSIKEKEKAKAYDEIVEKGKQILNTPYVAHWDIMKEVVEHLIPELKESEDEKIRKWIIDYFKENNAALAFRGISNECVIAWLEKQGGQKPAENTEPKFKAGDKVLVDGKVYIIKLVNEDNYIVDENGRDVQEHFSYAKDWKLIKQSFIWNEEDEIGLSDALWAIQQARTIAKDENDMGNLWYAEKWLKNLKDRVQ